VGGAVPASSKILDFRSTKGSRRVLHTRRGRSRGVLVADAAQCHIPRASIRLPTVLDPLAVFALFEHWPVTISNQRLSWTKYNYEFMFSVFIFPAGKSVLRCCWLSSLKRILLHGFPTVYFWGPVPSWSYSKKWLIGCLNQNQKQSYLITRTEAEETVDRLGICRLTNAKVSGMFCSLESHYSILAVGLCGGLQLECFPVYFYAKWIRFPLLSSSDGQKLTKKLPTNSLTNFF